MSQIGIGLKSAAPAGVHADSPAGVSKVRSAYRIRFARFMEPEILEDVVDLIRARRALADPSNQPIPWEQIKRDLGL
jgi:hypothetical protein